MTPLWQSLISLPLLDQAWEKVRANNGAAGGDGVVIAQFQAGAAKRLVALSKDLETGSWQPGPYRTIDIPKRKGGTRRLRIPSVVDRVVHTALATVLTPVLEPQFEDSSYAYRPGRSVQMEIVTKFYRWCEEVSFINSSVETQSGAESAFFVRQVCLSPDAARTPVLLKRPFGRIAANGKKSPLRRMLHRVRTAALGKRTLRR